MFWGILSQNIAHKDWSVEKSLCAQLFQLFFVNMINNVNIKTVWHRKLYMKNWYSSKSFWIVTFFFVLFLNSKCFNTTRSKYVPGGKMFQYSKLYTTNLIEALSLLQQYHYCSNAFTVEMSLLQQIANIFTVVIFLLQQYPYCSEYLYWSKYSYCSNFLIVANILIAANILIVAISLL